MSGSGSPVGSHDHSRMAFERRSSKPAAARPLPLARTHTLVLRSATGAMRRFVEYRRAPRAGPLWPRSASPHAFPMPVGPDLTLLVMLADPFGRWRAFRKQGAVEGRECGGKSTSLERRAAFVSRAFAPAGGEAPFFLSRRPGPPRPPRSRASPSPVLAAEFRPASERSVISCNAVVWPWPAEAERAKGARRSGGSSLGPPLNWYARGRECSHVGSIRRLRCGGGGLWFPSLLGGFFRSRRPTCRAGAEATPAPLAPGGHLPVRARSALTHAQECRCRAEALFGNAAREPQNHLEPLKKRERPGPLLSARRRKVRSFFQSR